MTIPDGWYRDGNFAFPGNGQWKIQHYQRLVEAVANINRAIDAVKMAQYCTTPFALHLQHKQGGLIYPMSEVLRELEQYRKNIISGITTAEVELEERIKD